MNNLHISIFALVCAILICLVTIRNKATDSVIGSSVYFEGDTSTIVDANFVNTTFILANGKIIDAHQVTKFIIKK